MINKPPHLHRGYNRDPNIQVLKRKGFVNHGSTLNPCKDCYLEHIKGQIGVQANNGE